MAHCGNDSRAPCLPFVWTIRVERLRRRRLALALDSSRRVERAPACAHARPLLRPVLGTDPAPLADARHHAGGSVRTLDLRRVRDLARVEAAALSGLVQYRVLFGAPISDWWYGAPYNVVDRELLCIHRPHLRLTGTQPGDIAAAL